MKEYFDILKNSTPFKNFEESEIEYVVKVLNLSVTAYNKNSIVLNQGDIVKSAGIVLEGRIIAESVSYSGERRLIQTHTKGSLFGDVLMSSEQPTPVSIIATEDSKILFLNFEKITEYACNPMCRKLLINMLYGIGNKFWFLNRKIAYLSCKSLRSRVAMFLLDSHKAQNTKLLHLPYNRDELASLLGANRSALSRELSRMQQENIITFYKSSFKIEDLQKLRNCL